MSWIGDKKFLNVIWVQNIVNSFRENILQSDSRIIETREYDGYGLISKLPSSKSLILIQVNHISCKKYSETYNLLRTTKPFNHPFATWPQSLKLIKLFLKLKIHKNKKYFHI